jgi:hypothetical protein
MVVVPEPPPLWPEPPTEVDPEPPPPPPELGAAGAAGADGSVGGAVVVSGVVSGVVAELEAAGADTPAAGLLW